MTMRVSEFYTTIHGKFQRGAMDLDAGSDLNPFVRLIRTSLTELAVAHHIDADLVHLHFLHGHRLRSHIHRKTGHDAFRRWRLVVERDNRHQVLSLGEFHAVPLGELGFRHFQSCAAEKKWLTGARDAGLVIVEHEDVMQIVSGERLPLFGEDSRFKSHHVHIFRQLKYVFGHGGCQVALVAGGKVNRPECERYGIVFDRDDGRGLILQGRNSMMIMAAVCKGWRDKYETDCENDPMHNSSREK